jgi:small subunit ribosomal protein S1
MSEDILDFGGEEDVDFESMLEGAASEFKSGFNPGEKVTGSIVDITSNSILVDVKATSEGIVDRQQFEEDGELTVAIGDSVDLFFSGMINGEITLTGKMKGQDVDRAELENACNAGIPIEGKVTGKNNAGLEVSVGGAQGFCPASQVDLMHIEDLGIFIGQVLTFKIIECSEYNLVLSRRSYLDSQREEKREVLKETLTENSMITGTVTKILDFGAFVDIGGMDGLIPIGEVAWERVQDVNEFITVGSTVTVKIIKLDWEKNRFTLSLKQAGSDPWDTLSDEFRTGLPYKATVTRLVDFGAFVQLKPGVEGLIHISKLGRGRRLSHPREVVEDGQEIEVFVESIDLERHRVSLALESTESSDDSASEGGQLFAVGQEVEGVVDEHRPFGAFIRIGDKRGLMHVSEMDAETGSRQMIIQKTCPLNSTIKVKIKEFRDGKISLTIPGKEDEANISQEMATQKKASKDFGSLGGMFDNL